MQHDQDDDPPPTPSNPPQPKTKSAAGSSKAESKTIVGSTAPIGEVSRERFSYWYLDLLFLICSDTSKGKVSWLLGDMSYAIYGISPFLDRESSRRRVAALCLPALIGRCRTTLAGYVADEKIRGSLPFPRYTTLIYGIICISFVIVTLSTVQGSRRGTDICAAQAMRAPTMAGDTLGGSLGITVEVCNGAAPYVTQFSSAVVG